MSTLEIKICGLTRLEDAQAAASLGADYLGFVLYAKSPRGIDAGRAKRIIDQLPKAVRAVGVFVNSPGVEVERIATDCGLYAVQIHGDESPAEFRNLSISVWRAVRFWRGRWVPEPSQWRAVRYVVDASVAGQYGGTGISANWTAARELAADYPVVLAGGLDPENVAEAVRAVRPTGVDVASGVESEPGKKDHQKLKAFVERARKSAGVPGNAW